MRILHVHNYYQQPGGEDQSFATQSALVEAGGHHLVRYTAHNDDIRQMSPLRLAAATIWNGRTYRELRALIRRERVQVAAFQNTFPLVSPSAYYAARAEGAAVVQTLSNYRLACLNGLFFRDGGVCEDCIGRPVPWPGVVHACYRDSRPASATAAVMLAVHRGLGTWADQVDAFIALTEFGRRKFVEAGLPKEKIFVKPHFVDPDPGVGAGEGGYALFVGRLSPEKGLDTLLSARARVRGRMPLKIVGDGPLSPRVREAAARHPDVEWLGHRPITEVYRLIGDASVLIFPSTWYETFGRVAIEAFAKGTPVIASRIGAVVELIDHGRTGLLFHAGDADDLAGQATWVLTHPSEVRQMRREARQEFEAKYSARANYEQLMTIYERAVGSA